MYAGFFCLEQHFGQVDQQSCKAPAAENCVGYCGIEKFIRNFEK